jgi:serine/threonine-protein kinase haspin
MKAFSEPAAALLSKEVTYSEKDCYDCLLDIENWLGDAIAEIAVAPKATAKGKTKQRKTEAAAPGKRPTFTGPARAGEIVAYGVKKGWIKPTVMT